MTPRPTYKEPLLLESHPEHWTSRTSAVLTSDIPPLNGVPRLVTVTAATSHVLTTHQVLRAGQRSHFPKALQPGLADCGCKPGFGDTRPGLSTLVPGCLP